jgi:hypothetical protein
MKFKYYLMLSVLILVGLLVVAVLIARAHESDLFFASNVVY